MKRLLIFTIIAIVLSAGTCYPITLDEFQKLTAGNIVHLKVEWSGKVRLEGDAVVAYKVNESAQLQSINPSDSWSIMAHRGFIQSIVTPLSTEQLAIDNIKLRTENDQLKLENAKLLAENAKKPENDTLQAENSMLKAENFQLKAESGKLLDKIKMLAVELKKLVVLLETAL